MRWLLCFAVVFAALASSAATAQRVPTYRPPARIEPYRPPPDLATPRVEPIPRYEDYSTSLPAPPPPEVAPGAADGGGGECTEAEVVSGACTRVERLPSCPGDPRCPGSTTSTPPPQ